MTDTLFLTLDRLFNSKDFKAKEFGPTHWLKDDDGFTTLELTGDDDKVKEIVRYDIQSGERSVILSKDQLIPEGLEDPLVIENYEWSANKKFLLIFTNCQRVWRQYTKGDFWLLEIESGQLLKIGGESSPSSLMFAKFSPDSQSIAYLYENNIFIQDIAAGSIRQLTFDGAEKIINGTSDWVYEEEFFLRDGFFWSPDSQSIAYWQFDTTNIETFYMIDNTASLYPKLIPFPYPKAGSKNSTCRIGVVSSAGGATTWIDIPAETEDYYLPKMEWAANSDQVIIQKFNRLQNRNAVMLGNKQDGSAETLFVEEDEAWIDAHNDLKWLDDGASFTWVSDRDGWRHIYRVSRDGREFTLLTPGAFDITAVQKVDEKAGLVYFIASPVDAGQRYLYSSKLDGSGDVQRLTPMEMPGYNVYDISPNGRYAFHTFSNRSQPPLVSLITLPEHQVIRFLESNDALRDNFDDLDLEPIEYFQVDPGDGVLLDGWCLKPPDFDPQEKYPTIFYVYGEPAGQTVVDIWPGTDGLWHHLMTQLGYIVITIDNKGTPGPRGREWRKQVYRQVGIMTTASQAAGARAVIQERPYIDTERIGVWGWSGGGTMTQNLMFNHPDLYKAGVALAGVSNLRYYDTVYQERYMDRPEDNEEGYTNGSPITHVEGLQGHLLLIHGTADDNVHYQCHEALVNELIKHNKQFSMMAYPNRTHSIKEGKNTKRHLYTLITNFFEANLKHTHKSQGNDSD